MGNLIRFLLRHHLLLVFIIIEGASLYMLAKESNYRQSVVLSKFDAGKSTVSEAFGRWSEYFSLRQTNTTLFKENAELRNKLELFKLQDTSTISHSADFEYIPANVIENSLNRRNNYLILNVGKNQGVEPEMGVISPDGVVGTVDRVSDNFCTVMSLLTTLRNVDGRLKNTGDNGPLVWNTENTRYVDLFGISQHVKVAIGDTVVTGYSFSFPPGITLGKVSDFEIQKGTNYKIKVELTNNFRALYHVYLVKPANKPEYDTIKSIAVKAK